MRSSPADMQILVGAKKNCRRSRRVLSIPPEEKATLAQSTSDWFLCLSMIIER